MSAGPDGSESFAPRKKYLDLGLSGNCIFMDGANLISFNFPATNPGDSRSPRYAQTMKRNPKENGGKESRGQKRDEARAIQQRERGRTGRELIVIQLNTWRLEAQNEKRPTEPENFSAVHWLAR